MAALRVLAVPELLDMIFLYMDDSSNATNACVCRQWSEVALDRLWRQVDDLGRLFSFLAPLESMSPDMNASSMPIGPRWKFSRIPTAEDWAVFTKYARRVRRLVHDEHLEDPLRFADSVFDIIGRTRTSLDILPNNQSLYWAGNLAFCVLFLHPGLRKLELWLPSKENASVDHYRPIFSDILARSPNITTLDIRARLPVHKIEAILVDDLSKLKRLKRLILPQYYLTTSIAEAASSLEELEVIEFQYPPSQGRGDLADVVVFNPSFEKGAFPSLWDLSMVVSFSDAGRFFGRRFAPEKLTLLYIESHQMENPSNFEHLITSVVNRCPLLKNLCVLSQVDGAWPIADPSPGGRINYASFRSILSLKDLAHLELHHQYPLDITEGDIEDLASRWGSRLEVLVLNCEPAYMDSSSLSLKALLPFATHCPSLTRLCLFIDASASNLPPPSSDSLPVFESLEKFWAGTSPIQDEGAVALFLSQICPEECQLDSGITWNEEDNLELDQSISEQIQDRCDKWSKVRELLPLLIRLRMEERERSKLLRSEVEDLRMRNDVLKNVDSKTAKSMDGCLIA